MLYVITFLEGVVSFISPCILPMLPVYLSYFAGGSGRDTKRTLLCASGFFLGFTAVFVTLGALSGLLGALLVEYGALINIVAGAIVVLFGLNYTGLFNIRLLNKTGGVGAVAIGTGKVSGFFSAMLFGVVFSVSWTPCVGAFLGSALSFASLHGSVVVGVLLLLCFSAGLGLPLLLSALLIDRIKLAFTWIKKHYRAINFVSGLFLVALGILMMTGVLSRLFDLLAA